VKQKRCIGISGSGNLKKKNAGSTKWRRRVDSRISHLNKIGQMVRLLCLANLLIGVTNTFSGASLAWLNLLCATFLAYGLGRISSKRESLVEERQLHE
jgi:hypothetical protein